MRNALACLAMTSINLDQLFFKSREQTNLCSEEGDSEVNFRHSRFGATYTLGAIVEIRYTTQETTIRHSSQSDGTM